MFYVLNNSLLQVSLNFFNKATQTMFPTKCIYKMSVGFANYILGETPLLPEVWMSGWAYKTQILTRKVQVSCLKSFIVEEKKLLKLIKVRERS